MAVSPSARAVLPAPDNGYINATTAAGNNALFSLTGGFGNTGLGENALYRNTGGNFNTATGDAALFTNGFGSWNTADGAGALVNNAGGNNNTALGGLALFNNTGASDNTALGYQSLFFNKTAKRNVAAGSQSLFANVSGDDNTAIGFMASRGGVATYENTAVGSYALYSGGASSGFGPILNTGVGFMALFANTQGNTNTAIGGQALQNHISGDENTAIGRSALETNLSGYHNTALGQQALMYCTGDDNIGLGDLAGDHLTSGAHNIDIGNEGVGGESGTTRIGAPADQTATYVSGIYGATADTATGSPVYVDSLGRLGTVLSSARFKEAIEPMAKKSDALLALRPVTFHYKKELDSAERTQFGLVAEEVEKVDPDLVIHDEKGKPYTVRYEAVNAMLLNEFLKEHQKAEEQGRKITAQGATVAQLKALASEQAKAIRALKTGFKAQAAQIERVSARLTAGDVAPRVVAVER